MADSVTILRLARRTANFIASAPVIHPFLFAIYPILFLWSLNIEELSISSSLGDLGVPAGISFGAAAVLLLMGSFILRDARKAGVIVALLVLLFFSYVRAFDILTDAGILGSLRQRYFLLAWVALFFIGGFSVVKIKANFGHITNLLNVAALVLIVLPLVNIISNEFRSDPAIPLGQVTQSSAQNIRAGNVEWKPDIYYIILDAYTSSAYLQKSFNFDNQSFTDFLTGKGFNIPQESRSNYGNTTLSLASSLNMEYLDHLADVMPQDSQDPTVYLNMARQSKVLSFLKDQGYKAVYFRQVWMPKSPNQAQDLYLGCENQRGFGITGDHFSGALIQTTMLEPFFRQAGLIASSYQSRALCEFSRIIAARNVEGPKIVFAHVNIPHPPFVFGRNGERLSQASGSLTQWSSKSQYIDQLIFVNRQMEPIIQELLSETSEPPVIIIQGDHGTGFTGEGYSNDVYKERFSIINAYLLPGGGDELLYPSITPVNTFRVVFNHYFDTNLDLLDDTSFYTNFDEGWFNYLDVTPMITNDG